MVDRGFLGCGGAIGNGKGICAYMAVYDMMSITYQYCIIILVRYQLHVAKQQMHRVVS